MVKKETIKTFVKNSPKDGDMVFLKVEPIRGFCCCSDCVPELWTKINNEIHPQGPIEHEGFAVLTFHNEQLILEQHESGPELLAFLQAITTMYNFLKLLFSLSINSFAKKGATKIKITKRVITTKQKIVAEEIFEIDLKNKNEKELDKVLNKIIRK